MAFRMVGIFGVFYVADCAVCHGPLPPYHKRYCSASHRQIAYAQRRAGRAEDSLRRKTGHPRRVVSFEEWATSRIGNQVHHGHGTQFTIVTVVRCDNERAWLKGATQSKLIRIPQGVLEYEQCHEGPEFTKSPSTLPNS
jgi:hypothetical protein